MHKDEVPFWHPFRRQDESVSDFEWSARFQC